MPRTREPGREKRERGLEVALAELHIGGTDPGALTRMRTWPGPGSGNGTSLQTRTSGWFWDYKSEQFFEGPVLVAPEHHPLEQPVPVWLAECRPTGRNVFTETAPSSEPSRFEKHGGRRGQ